MKDLVFKNNRGTVVHYKVLRIEEGIIISLGEDGKKCYQRECDVDKVRWVRGQNRRFVLTTSEERADELLKLDYLYLFSTDGSIYPVEVVKEYDKGVIVKYSNTERYVVPITSLGSFRPAMLIPSNAVNNRTSNYKHGYAVSREIAQAILKKLGVEVKSLNY